MDTSAPEIPPPVKRRGRPGPTNEEACAVMRAAGLEPLCDYPGSNIPWPARCRECKETVSPRYGHVKNGSSKGCKHCGERNHPKHQLRIDPDEAAAVMRAAGLEPLVPFPGVAVPWMVCCLECGETRTPRFEHVRNGVSKGCKPCAGLVVDPEEARQVMLAAGLEPLEPYPGNNKAPWKIRCVECKNVNTVAYQQTRRHGTGCRRCAGRILDPEEMAQMMRDNGFDPIGAYPGMDKAWRCICRTCKHEGPKLAQHVRAGSGCMRCAGRILPAEEAAERMEAAGFIPQEPYPGQNTARWACICQACKTLVYPSYRRVMQSGLAGCCGGTYDLTRPGRSMGLYLIVHPELNAAKIGIALSHFGRMSRVDRHRSHGWIPVATWAGITELHLAFAVEKHVIQSWRGAGLPAFLTPTQMPQWGSTETVQLDLIDQADIITLVNDELGRLGVAPETFVA